MNNVVSLFKNNPPPVKEDGRPVHGVSLSRLCYALHAALHVEPNREAVEALLKAITVSARNGGHSLTVQDPAALRMRTYLDITDQSDEAKDKRIKGYIAWEDHEL